MFNTLSEKDIQGKIDFDMKEKGIDIYGFRKLIAVELFLHYREILKIKFELSNMNIIKYLFKIRDYRKIMLPYEIQVANLIEQLDYVDRLIENPSIMESNREKVEVHHGG